MTKGQNSIILQTYNDRSSGIIGCDEIHTSTGVNTYMVILNDDNNINMPINDFGFTDLNQPFKTERFINKSTSQSPVGYFSELTNINNKPNYGDMVRMEILKVPNTNSGVPTNNFDPMLTHQMYYLISNTKYDINTFWQGASSMVNITPIYQLGINGNTYYCGDFPFTSIGSQTHIYMVWDYRIKN